jgi:hypothetical protein
MSNLLIAIVTVICLINSSLVILWVFTINYAEIKLKNK